MAAEGSGGETARPWAVTSTWAPAGGGAVEDAVSFETTDEDAEASPAGVVLARPAPDADGDAPPCEVTVSFRGKYEIHRVYVRSTARIYEIYHSTDARGTSKDYLCTVRCGPVVEEPLPSVEESTAQWSSSASTSEKHEHDTKSVSSSSTDDSWVDVKIPESPMGNNISESQEKNVARTCQENNLAHYEATAEMTDVSPCVSLTVRLLSLQSKATVHIEEIYIFADPVESTNDNSDTGPGNMGGSSLLAMLVPGLMQMSKSRNYKIDDGYFSHASRTQPTQDHAVKESSSYEKTAEEIGPSGIERGIDRIDSESASHEKSHQGEIQFKDHKSVPLSLQTAENTQVPSMQDQQALDADQPANPLMNGNFPPYNHIEKKLDTLLSKVEKMELYCSRFEDSMIKPLGSIEARLQRLEQQFDSFSVDIQCLRSSARMSAPDGVLDTKSQGKVHNDGNAQAPASITDRKPGLVVRAPDFSLEDSFRCNVADESQVNFCGPNMVPRLLVRIPEFISQPELNGEKLHEGPFSPVDCAVSSEQKERKTSPGLVVKVPEFPDDDDDEDEVEEEKEAEVGDHDDDHTRDDTLFRNTTDSSKSKNHVSVNGALASALEALLMSTKGTSSSKSVCHASNVSEHTNDSPNCSLLSGKFDEMSTKDGSVDQVTGAHGNGNLDGTCVSCQKIDAAPHSSLSKPMLDGKVEVNEENNYFNSDKVAFVASSSSLGVPSQHHTVEESTDDGSCVNEQTNGPKLDTMPFVASTEPLDPPQPPTACESVDNGAQVNENRSAISLAEFLAARNSNSCKNGTPEVCGSTDGAEILSFERTSAGAGKNLTNISQLLVKKALEVDDEDDTVCCVPVGASFKGSSYAAPGYVANGHKIETVLDKDCGLENTENSYRLSVGMNSVFPQCSATGSEEQLTEESSLEWTPGDNFSKLNAEDSWSDLSSMESFSGARAIEPAVSANTAAGKHMEDLLAGIGVSSTMTPVAGEELQKVCDLLYEYKNDMLGMTSTEKRTSKSIPSLEVLLAESSDSEAQISDVDIDKDAGFDSAQLFGSFSSSDDDASAEDKPLVDVADLTPPSEPYASALNEPLVDVADLIDTSGTGIYAPAVNQPLADVFDEPNTSETHASGMDEPLADDKDAGCGSAQLSGSFSSSDDGASAKDKPLVDVADLITPSEPYSSALDESLVDVADLTDTSGTGTYASAVNQPSGTGTYAPVFDEPNPSDTHASGMDEPLANVEDTPKPLETFAGGSSGEHPESLI